ncbi:hypothetical protein F5Y08DRAFT_138338 [Xylaria arbuscula]|nr:hypothetical protein F5Y08DRAFT_138338 [Xylaria arbuscula]
MKDIKNWDTSDESDDYDKSLQEITARYEKPLISLLLDIQESQVQQQNFFRFIRRLECFSLDRKQPQPMYRNKPQHKKRGKQTLVFRRRINALEDREFVAVSYPWEPSDDRENCKLKYKVQDRSGKHFYPSTLRDCVWDRTFNYMRARNVKLLWVDRQSIPQRECKAACSHKGCKQKRAAVQTMDLVYQRSHHPIALLENHMCSLDDLNILVAILQGKLAKGNGKTRQFQLSEETSLDKAQRALGLLIAITGDRWWTRAWIFQENYVARKNMTLLIRHPPDLEIRKRESNIFGDVPGELCINSTEFCHQATRLCLALRMHGVKGIDQVVDTAGEYRLLLQSSDSMTAKIINDVERRDAEHALDRLPIIANCCQYSVRLHTQSQQAPSLSLATLAMCLLNGEILHNGPRESTSGLLSEMTILECLETFLFQGFCVPRGKPDLTFNKGCRFINVRLTGAGVLTNGHLWRLGPMLDTATFPVSKVPQTKSKVGSLTPYQQDRLTQLATILRSLSHRDLATQIETSLDRIDKDQYGTQTFSRDYLRSMAIEMVRAIDQKRKLRLASLCKSQSITCCTAIFIWDDDDHTNMPNLDDFAFTASAPRKKNVRDIDRHVSLQVRCRHLSMKAGNDIPMLYLRRWLHGLCFFSGCPRMDVLFPWPSALKTINT